MNNAQLIVDMLNEVMAKNEPKADQANQLPKFLNMHTRVAIDAIDLIEGLEKFYKSTGANIKVRSIYSMEKDDNVSPLNPQRVSDENATVFHWIPQYCKTALAGVHGTSHWDANNFAVSATKLVTEQWPVLFIWNKKVTRYVVVEFCSNGASERHDLHRPDADGSSSSYDILQLILSGETTEFPIDAMSDQKHRAMLDTLWMALKTGDIVDIIDENGIKQTEDAMRQHLARPTVISRLVRIKSGLGSIKLKWNGPSVQAVQRIVGVTIEFHGICENKCIIMARFLQSLNLSHSSMNPSSLIDHAADGEKDLISKRGYVDITYSPPATAKSKDKMVALRDTTFSVVTDTYQLAAMTLQYLRNEIPTTPIDVFQIDAAREILGCLAHGAEDGFKEFSFKPEHGFPTIVITSGNDKKYRFTLI